MSPIQSQIPPEPKKEESKSTHWITTLSVAVFILLALGVVIFLYNQNQQLKSMLANYQTQSSPAPSASPDVTANWKIYTDPGFSFKYPPEMNIATSSAANVAYLETSDFKIGTSGYQIQITKVKSNIQTIDQFMQIIPNTPEQTFLDKQSVTTINGNQAVVRTYQGAWNIYKKYYLYSPKLAVILQGIGQDHSTFDQILSTFTFISPSPSPASTNIPVPTGPPSAIPAGY